ncbi:MAG: DUF6754 domain-containing protein, partial [Candidatus Riflebacteria bacterium]
MSVTWRPPRMLLPVLAVILCLVSALSLVAQQEEIPAASPSEPTAVSEPVVTETAAPAAIAPEVPAAPAEPTAAATEVAPAAAVQDQPAAEPVSETVAEPVTPTPVAPVTTEPVAQPEPAAASTNEPVSEEKAAEPVATAVAPASASAPAAAAVPAATEVKPEEKKGLAYYVDVDRINVLVIIICLLGFVSYFTFHAQRGKEMFIRRISGLSALEDAVGRATEMGRGVLYIPGIMDMDDIQTIAGVTILGHVAKKTAEYDTPLFAPMTRSFVMSV